MGVRAMLTEAGRRAVVAWAFVAGIVTWRRARIDHVENVKLAWTDLALQWRDGQAGERPQPRPGMVLHMRPDETISVVGPGYGPTPMRTVPVMEVRRVLNDEAVRMCRDAGRDELVEYAWLARFEHEGTRHDQCSSGPLKAIRNSSHEMLRCKVLPEHGPRLVLVQMVKDGEVVYAFELDVAKPAWMVTARQCVEDALG